MTPRPLVRRPLQVGGLLLATAALGTAVAPAASAMVDTTAPVDQSPVQAPVAAPRVLTTSPGSFLGTPQSPVAFGTGKLQISVAPEPGVEVPAGTDLAGAVVRVEFPDRATPVGEDDEDGTDAGDAAVPSTTCTTDATGVCLFGADNLGGPGVLFIFPGDAYTLTQVQAPSSGALTVPAGQDAVVHGRGVDPDTGSGTTTESGTTAGSDTPAEDDGQLISDDAVPFAPRATPAVSGAGRPTTGSVVFFDPLLTASAGQPGTVDVTPTPVVPPVTAAADSSAPVVPVVPVSADASAAPATATTTATATLATTGTDIGPMAAVGGGLLVAGAAGLVLARRRAPR